MARYYKSNTATVAIDEEGRYALLTGILSGLDRDELSRIANGRYEDYLENEGVVPASVVTDIDGDEYGEYTVVQYLGYIGWTECEQPTTPYEAVISQLAALNGCVQVVNDRTAGTGSIYVTIRRITDDAHLAIRFADHDECYAPDGEQVNVHATSLECLPKAIAKITDWATK